MRVTSWNCQHLFGRGKDIDRCMGLLSRLDADLVTLQECRRRDAHDPSIIWRGENDDLGTAVVSTSASLPIERIEIPGLHPTVVPVVVHAAEPFVFVGVWTHEPFNKVAWDARAGRAGARGRPRGLVPGGARAAEPFVFVGVWTHEPFNKVAWDAMAACEAAADDLDLPMVAAGDFNSSPCVQGQERASREFLGRMRDELGLVSAYHRFHDVDPCDEPHATYYHQRKKDKPFHIDYCFVPETWADRLTGVEVGTFEEWRESDHRPLTVDIAD